MKYKRKKEKERMHHLAISIKKSFEEGVINISFLDEITKLKNTLGNPKETNKKITDFKFGKKKTLIFNILNKKKRNPKTDKEKEKEFEKNVKKLMEENRKAYNNFIKNFKELIKNQIKTNTPVISIYLCGSFNPQTLKNLVFVNRDENSLFNDKKIELGTKYVDNINKRIENFFNFLKHNELIHKNKIKISVFGKWYDLPENIIDAIKSTMIETKDYDNFFLNICINYDGQEEILSSAKILCKKTELKTISPERITKEDLKENIYSSYFPPPNKIVIFGGIKKLDGFLMWDSANSIIWFEDSDFLKVSKSELKKIFKKN